MEGPWLSLYRGLSSIREGRFDEGEALLREIPQGGGMWEISANRGRILEAKRSFTEALGCYEIAASQVTGNIDAAKIQLRIARCLRSLDRSRESRRVLEYAQTLDRENLNIRLELQRLENSPGH
jgi:tetratricopeptide (TPR) repeat protein